MADEEELYLANLDEFVNDENRIVSFLHSTFFKCTCLIIFLKIYFWYSVVFLACFISGNLQMVESNVVSIRKQSETVS